MDRSAPGGRNHHRWQRRLPEGSLGNHRTRKERRRYFLTSGETVWLLIVYKKAKFDNLPTTFIAQLRKAVQDAL